MTTYKFLASDSATAMEEVVKKLGPDALIVSTSKKGNKVEIEATTIKNISDILKIKTKYEIIGIDEAQFFSDQIIEVCNLLANQGIRVIIAGLDMDYSGKPFGPMPFLMAIAEQVTKVHATCDETGEPALYSYRKIENSETIMIGEKKEYMPLSRKAYISKIRKK